MSEFVDITELDDDAKELIKREVAEMLNIIHNRLAE